MPLPTPPVAPPSLRRPRRAVIAHCWQGAPDQGWYPWAAEALATQGFDVCVPALPEPDAPRLEAWLAALDAAVGAARTPTLLIGHSLGALAALHWIARRSDAAPLAGLLVVAPPLRAVGIPAVDAFLVPGPDLAAAARRAARAAVLVSDADRYLLPTPGQVANDLAAHGFEVLVAPGRGHFAPSSGLVSLPEITAWTAALADRPS